MALSPLLIQQYNKPVPRYTSYPTVPFWENDLDENRWGNLVKKAYHEFGKEKGISLYIHLPFCESLCTYCGCNKRITKNHQVEDPYIQSLLLEWEKYLAILEEEPLISSIHLGGGTPTFFSPESLNLLLSKILKSGRIAENREFSFEGHPNNTSFEHLEMLSKLGFDRVSYGIQDFDLAVQKAIHRIQPFEKVKEATENARQLGYQSVNFDLIYGLPLQTLETLADTFEKVGTLRPERIAFYSYAHLPKAFTAQKSFENQLPTETLKRALYEFGKERLLTMGYEEVGMDHFALPDDPLCQAKHQGSLHRNFMGYTPLDSKILLGLGASSISDVWYGFSQNEKNVEAYENSLQNHVLPIFKGHQLTTEDLLVRQLILDLICTGEAEVPFAIWEKLPVKNLEALHQMENEGLLSSNRLHVQVTEDGMALIRNICTQFDLRMISKNVNEVNFSKAI